jgi:sodium-dependent dicarboxylate transporter 2/3/5
MALVLQLATRPSEAGGGNPQIDLRVTENFGSVLMLAIAYAASLGGMATLVGTPTNLVFTGTVRKLFPAAPEVGFLQWMAVGLPLLALFLPLSWLYLCRFGGAAPLRDIRFASSQTVIEEELRKLGKITRPERSVLVIWVATAFLWIFRSPIDFGSFRVPGWSQLFGKPAFLHDATVAMTMAVVLCLIPVNAPVNVPANRGSVAEEKSGGRSFLMDWHTIRHGVPWGVLFLFGGGFAMAAAFEQTGLSSWAGSALRHLAGFPPIVMVALTSLAITFLSEVTSNTATALMVMPILAAAAVPVGIHPYLLMISGTLGASCGFMLPVATPPNAIVFSSGWITAPQMARAGLALDLMGVALITLVIYLLAVPVFGITLGQLPAWAQ